MTSGHCGDGAMHGKDGATHGIEPKGGNESFGRKKMVLRTGLSKNNTVLIQER